MFSPSHVNEGEFCFIGIFFVILGNLTNRIIMEKDLDLKSAFNVVSAFGGRRQEESEKERLLSVLRGKDISEVVNLMLCNGNTYNRRILRFFRWFCKWIPIAVMITHWYGIWDFSQHPREMFVLDKENLSCYLWMYFMLYVLPMVIIAASRFFFLCWKYRIPFFYFFGVNALHLSYGSLFTTNEMVTPHFALVLFVCLLYVYAFGEMALNTKIGKKLI